MLERWNYVCEVLPQFDIACDKGPIISAPKNPCQDVQEDLSRGGKFAGEILSQSYEPDLIPFWPWDKPIFLPESMVPEQMKETSKKYSHQYRGCNQRRVSSSRARILV
jgi:hypothetical protein